MNILSLRNIKKSFNNHNILNLSVNIEENKLTSIVGKSGSGKSSLLNILGLLDFKYEGEYFINGKVIEKKKDYSDIRLSKMGFIFQNYNLLEYLTGYENIILPLKYAKKDLDLEYYLYIIDLLQIEHIINHEVSVLSGGEKQRVSIARALIMKPKILFADEPTGNLDEGNTLEIIKLFLKIKDTTTIVLITHNLNLIKYCDRTLILKSGNIYENQ